MVSSDRPFIKEYTSTATAVWNIPRTRIVPHHSLSTMCGVGKEKTPFELTLHFNLAMSLLLPLLPEELSPSFIIVWSSFRKDARNIKGHGWMAADGMEEGSDAEQDGEGHFRWLATEAFCDELCQAGSNRQWPRAAASRRLVTLSASDGRVHIQGLIRKTPKVRAPDVLACVIGNCFGVFIGRHGFTQGLIDVRQADAESR
ncbi:hypothetical protein B0T10DRAFT_551794 [Thelonectria olida]|uniref:Uncharacterized protein n=1 Tax=Thelonectria olida TaxID=1576542 RepID=A0A9P9AMZ2_9HYPO|nr:hypothetical protein B0T10DRAFT_551794 [Thelonectria olida]